LSWGATPYLLDGDYNADNVAARAVEQACAAGEVRRGDLVAVLSGSTDYPGQATDTLRMVPVT
ncbi:MAG TPA: hypothetical protein VGM93_01555, partial [Acidimicrobiales bacterium]